MSKLNSNVKLVIGLLLLFALLAAAFYFYLLPAWRDIAAIRSEINQLEARKTAAEQVIQREEQINAEWQRTVPRRQLQEVVLPLPENEDYLLKDLDAYLAGNPVDSFNLSEIETGEELLYRQATLSLSGSISGLAESLRRLEHFSHPLNYSIIGLSGTDDAYNLQLSLQVYLGDDGRTQPPREGSGNEQTQ